MENLQIYICFLYMVVCSHQTALLHTHSRVCLHQALPNKQRYQMAFITHSLCMYVCSILPIRFCSNQLRGRFFSVCTHATTTTASNTISIKKFQFFHCDDFVWVLRFFSFLTATAFSVLSVFVMCICIWYINRVQNVRSYRFEQILFWFGVFFCFAKLRSGIMHCIVVGRLNRRIRQMN